MSGLTSSAFPGEEEEAESEKKKYERKKGSKNLLRTLFARFPLCLSKEQNHLFIFVSPVSMLSRARARERERESKISADTIVKK